MRVGAGMFSTPKVGAIEGGRLSPLSRSYRLSLPLKPVAGDAVMRGIAHGDHCESVLPGFVQSHGHGSVACDHSHSVVGVEDGCRRCLPDDIDLCNRILDARGDPVDVYGLEPVAPVALDAAAVALQKNVGANGRVQRGYSVTDKGVRQKRSIGPGDVRSGFYDRPPIIM